MSVNSEAQYEYELRHNPIWADLSAVLRSHGVLNYSIFLEPASSQLFAYVDIESEERWDAIAATEPCKRWWRYMKDIMPSNEDGSPISTELKEVFRLDK